MEDDPVADVRCPGCGRILSFPPEYTGTVRECPDCFEAFVLPCHDGELATTLNIPLSTSDLVLRRLKATDAGRLCDIISDREVRRFVPNTNPSNDDILRWLEADSHLSFARGDELCLAIELKHQDVLFGLAALRFHDESHIQAKMTMLVPAERVESPYAVQAALTLLRFGFVELNLHRVTASCKFEAPRCCALYRKIGMRFEGEFVEDDYQDEEWTNTRWFGLLEREYFKAHGGT